MVVGTRASSVDGELPWRSSGRASAVASAPGSRMQAATEGGFLGLRHKTKSGGRRLKTPSRGGTGVGLGTDGGNGRRRRLGPRCGRGGDGRRAASRAVRRPRRERRLGPRRGGGNLPARGVLAVFSKPAIYPGFTDLPKPWTKSSSRWWHRGEDFVPNKEPQPSDKIVYRGILQTNRSDRSLAPV